MLAIQDAEALSRLLDKIIDSYGKDARLNDVLGKLTLLHGGISDDICLSLGKSLGVFTHSVRYTP